MLKFDRKLILEDGSEYSGYCFGSDRDRVCELVFNTAMVGYQEIVSDPSYTDRFVVMTYPLIGNCGIADEDLGNKKPSIGALIVRDYNDMPSNFRYTKTLSELLEENDIPGIYGLDTRKLTGVLRTKGSLRALITNVETTVEEGLSIIEKTPIAHDAVARVSCKKRWYSRTSNPRFNVTVVDCGIEVGTIRTLNAWGCNVTVMPYDTSAEEIDFMRPDGVFISNGPGTAEDVPAVVELVKALRGKYPLFGSGLGHQVIALAYGGSICNLGSGHWGANHPVRNLATGNIEITSQNHGCAVDAASLEQTGLQVTHVNVLDGTVEAVACPEDRVFGVQYHPESALSTEERDSLFCQFLNEMEEVRKHA